MSSSGASCCIPCRLASNAFVITVCWPIARGPPLWRSAVSFCKRASCSRPCNCGWLLPDWLPCQQFPLFTALVAKWACWCAPRLCFRSLGLANQTPPDDHSASLPVARPNLTPGTGSVCLLDAFPLLPHPGHPPATLLRSPLPYSERLPSSPSPAPQPSPAHSISILHHRPALNGLVQRSFPSTGAIWPSPTLCFTRARRCKLYHSREIEIFSSP